MVDLYTFNLMSLAEEISEMNIEGQAAIKAISKLIRFGKGFPHPRTGITGIENLRSEMIDVIAGIFETRVLEDMTPEEILEAIKKRQHKIRETRAISEERGMLVVSGVETEIHDEKVLSLNMGFLSFAASEVQKYKQI